MKNQRRFTVLAALVFAFNFLFTLATYSLAQAPTAPSYCHPCLFYGGDIDPANPNTGWVGNQNTEAYHNQAVYIPFRVPPNQTWEVIGLFVNELSDTPQNDPPQMNWSISKGIAAGRKGVQIAGGSIDDAMTPTGRTYYGYTEYTVLGYLSPTTIVNLTPGVYWMTAVPDCIIESGICNASNGNTAGFWLGTVEDVPPPNAVGVEPWDESFMLYPDGGVYYVSISAGEDGICQFAPGCDRVSAGILGRVTVTN